MRPLPFSESPRLPLALLLAVLAVGCDAMRIGDPCEISLECQPGQSCYRIAPADAGFPPDAGFQDGFCSRACDAEGSGGGCPGGSLCARSAGLLVCAPLCGEGREECRPGYACQQVGEDKACVAVPQ